MSKALIALRAAAVAAVSLVASVAAADECFDASDEARALLGRRQLLEARARLRTCAASTCDEAVRVLCDERLAELTARLPTIIFDVKDPDGRDRSNVALAVDGTTYADGALGAELTLDPGRHVFRFASPNETPLEQSFVLVEREKGRREHIVLGRAAEHGAALAPAEASATATAPAKASPWQTAGWITLGAGAVGLGIGAAFGVSAIAQNADAHCDASNVCEDPRSRHDARIAANVSTAGIVVGGVLAATGIALLVFAPKTATQGAGTIGLRVGSSAGGGALLLAKTW